MSRSRSATTQTSGLELELSEHGHRRLHGAHKGPGGGRQQQSRVGGGMSNHLGVEMVPSGTVGGR